MAIRSLAELKSRFQTADVPDGSDFVDLIDTLAVVTNLNGAALVGGSVALVKLTPGAILQKIRTNASGTTAEWADDNQTSLVVGQTAHGFAVPDAVYINASGTFLKARADMASTGQCVGVVGAVIDANTFVLVINGKVSAATGDWDTRTGGTGGLTAGTLYYLSDSFTGGFTTVAPSNVGNTVQTVLLAISAATALVLQQPALTVGSGQITPESISKAWVNFDGRAEGSGVGTFTSGNVSTLNDTIDPTNDNFGYICSVRLTTTGTLPSPLAILTTYWMRGIPASITNPVMDLYSLYPTRLDAENLTNKIDLTTTGSGTQTVTRREKSRTTQTAVPGDVSTGADEITLTAHTFNSVAPVLVSSSSTLPAPLLVNTLYWLKSIDANTIALYNLESDAQADLNRIDLTTTGVGVHTFDAGQRIRSSLNVDYVERLNQGVYRLWFRVPFIAADYVAQINTSATSTTGLDAPTDQDIQTRIDLMLPGKLQISTGFTSGGATILETSSEVIAVTAFGNQ